MNPDRFFAMIDFLKNAGLKKAYIKKSINYKKQKKVQAIKDDLS